MKKLIHEEILHAKKALQEDLDEFGIIGNGFWEATEQKIFNAIEKELTQKRQELSKNTNPFWIEQNARISMIDKFLEEFKREKS